MKIRSLSLAVLCVLWLGGSASAEPGAAFLEARGGALIPVGDFSHEQNPGGAYTIAAGYEFLPFLDLLLEFTHAFNENDEIPVLEITLGLHGSYHHAFLGGRSDREFVTTMGSLGFRF